MTEGSPDPRQSASDTDDAARWDLCLYIAGQSEKSRLAIGNLRQICEQHLPGRYRLDVVDLLNQPHLATADDIVAVPTLVRRHPLPLRRIIGDLSDRERVALQLQADAGGP